jgi:hypothetical protein
VTCQENYRGADRRDYHCDDTISGSPRALLSGRQYPPGRRARAGQLSKGRAVALLFRSRLEGWLVTV